MSSIGVIGHVVLAGLVLGVVWGFIPADRFVGTPRLGARGQVLRARLSESPSPPHANPLFRMWATPPTCGTGGLRAEQAAHVRNRRPTCGTGAGVRAQHDAVATQASSRGSRNERLDFLIGDADQHVVKDPGEACGPREVFRRGRRTIGGVNDVAVSVLGVEGPDI